MTEAFEVVVSGSGRERGLQHGRACPDLVRGCYDRFGKFEGARPGEVEGILQTLEHSLRQALPDVLEEIEGIAQGASMSYEEIMQLNFCEEIWNRTTGWCTTICFTDTPDGPLVAKTQDVGEGDEQFTILQKVENSDGGHDFIRGTFAGTIWTTAGINAAGLALAGSSIKPRSLGREGVPMHAALQACLERCATVEAAEDMLSGFTIHGKGINLMMADDLSNAMLTERLPARQAPRYPRGGVLFATNHCGTPDMQVLLVDDQEWLDNSTARYALLSQATRTVPQSREGMESLLRLHSPTGSICQHGGAGGRFHTIAAYVLAPTQRELWLAKGSPCKNRFVRFKVQ